MGKIPFHRLPDARVEIIFGLPSQLARELGRIDGIAPVVARTVGDEGNQALRLAQNLQNRLDDVQIRPLVMAADVIDLPRPALMQNEIDGGAVVIDMQPVTDVFSLAIDGQALVMERPGDDEGNQLLGEVIGAIVIRAPGDGDGLVIRPGCMPGPAGRPTPWKPNRGWRREWGCPHGKTDPAGPGAGRRRPRR